MFADILSLLNIIKIAAAVAMVLVLSFLAERVSPRFAGVFSGFPLGAAISLFFIGYEIGPRFAGQAAVFSTAGLTAILFFDYGYYWAARRAENLGRGLRVVIALVVGLAAYFLAALVLERARVGLWAAVFITTSAVFLFDRMFRKVANAPRMSQPRIGWGATLIRGLFAGSVVVAVTMSAMAVGPAWAGLFSAFPITLLPFLVIIHYAHEPPYTYTILKNLPRGLMSLVIYCTAVSLLYPRIGVGWGTAAAYLLATVYLVIISLRRTSGGEESP
jgi:sterol desaturase/sphingolipid hydroxylase (fatty acid hydroxylase superfamily)